MHENHDLARVEGVVTTSAWLAAISYIVPLPPNRCDAIITCPCVTHVTVNVCGRVFLLACCALTTMNKTQVECVSLLEISAG